MCLLSWCVWCTLTFLTEWDMGRARSSDQKPKLGTGLRREKKKRHAVEKKRAKLPKQKVTQPRLPKSANEVSSNWKALSAVLSHNKKEEKGHKRKQQVDKSLKSSKFTPVKPPRLAKSENNDIWFDDVDPEDIERSNRENFPISKLHSVSKEQETGSVEIVSSTGTVNLDNPSEQKPRLTKCVAMDCEFVGIGQDGAEHMLGRVSVVNSYGDVLYDQYVAPQERIVDFRTKISGIRASNLKNAPSFVDVQKNIAGLIKNRTLVGHAITSDLKVLFLDHPRRHIRDTSKYKPFQQRVKTKRPSLKKLAKEILSLSIQSGEHSSVEDARAAMQLYREHRREWEKSIKETFKKSNVK